ncbi:acyl-CoA carboxylase subunit beta [Nocardia suismassiliense]|uniref:Acyl-CoA carboxylase subunit beta n=1 Tax=Nocardia suismassiliense TaxID=2077092 RepID=A0ABW6R5M0_9NOCA
MSRASTAESLSDLCERLLPAQEPAREAGIAKRASEDIPGARDRIGMLLDPATFVEIGALVCKPGEPGALYGGGVVTGYGLVEGRPVAVYAHDQSVFCGSVGEAFGRKVATILKFAAKVGCPVVGITDSDGVRDAEPLSSLAWHAELVRRQEPLSGYVPQVSMVFGRCVGSAVFAPINSDVLVATEDAYLSMTGLEVVSETNSLEELGGAWSQAEYGNIHHVAKDEKSAFEWVRQYLGYLPTNCRESAPIVNPGLEPQVTETDLDLNVIVPDADSTGYDMREILLRIFDDGAFHEIEEAAARNLVTGFARVDGRSVGVVANQPMVAAGTLDARAADKAAHFVRLCDAFEIPLIFVVDTPGFLPGAGQEKIGVIKRGGRFIFAFVEATVPKVTVVVRKSYGGGYAVMGSKQLGADVNLAWPTARIAVMGAESAVSLIGAQQLAAVPAPERAAVRQQMIDFYNATMATPWVAAERGYIDAVIEPSATRLELRRALRLLRDKIVIRSPRKHYLLPL